MILGLDLATRCGWALVGNTTRYGTWALDTDCEAARLADLYGKLDHLLREENVSAVVFEDVKRHMSQRNAAVYLGLRAVLLLVAREHFVGVHPVNVSTLKVWATGDSRAPKIDMVREANKRAGLSLTLDEHDAADAVLCALWGIDKLCAPVVPTPPAQSPAQSQCVLLFGDRRVVANIPDGITRAEVPVWRGGGFVPVVLHRVPGTNTFTENGEPVAAEGGIRERSCCYWW